MDAIAVARAGIGNVVASCGTSLAEPQIKLLARFTKRVIVNYDPDNAGQAATERSLALLLEQDFEVRVLALPPVGDKKADPDLFIREKGAEAYRKVLEEVAALRRLFNCSRAPDGSHDRRRENSRGKFSASLRAKNPKSPASFRMGHANRAAVAASMSRYCAQRYAKLPPNGAAR